MACTNVFFADVFQPLHILFKYFENTSVASRTVCKDIYDYMVFIVYLQWVIHKWILVPSEGVQFMIRSLLIQRFKYCVVSVSIGEFMRFIYYSPYLHMFDYEFWRILIFRLNDSMSQTFQFLVITYDCLFMISRWP